MCLNNNKLDYRAVVKLFFPFGLTDHFVCGLEGEGGGKHPVVTPGLQWELISNEGIILFQ